MKKVISAFLVILGLVFIACENETKNGDPSIIAMVNNDVFAVNSSDDTSIPPTHAMKFETWRPQYTDLKVANENVFYLKAETDTTLFSIRVPYTLFENNDKRSFEFGDVIQATEVEDEDVAFATYRVYDNKNTKTLIAIYKTHSDEKVVGKAGVFSYGSDDKKQVPGTITATFNANMKKEKPEGFDQFTKKQVELYNALNNVKSFQEGVIYRMPVSAGK